MKFGSNQNKLSYPAHTVFHFSPFFFTTQTEAGNTKTRDPLFFLKYRTNIIKGMASFSPSEFSSDPRNFQFMTAFDGLRVLSPSFRFLSPGSKVGNQRVRLPLKTNQGCCPCELEISSDSLQQFWLGSLLGCNYLYHCCICCGYGTPGRHFADWNTTINSIN